MLDHGRTVPQCTHGIAPRRAARTRWRWAALAIGMAASTSASANRYMLVDLGEDPAPSHISNRGEISAFSDGHAARWRAGHWHELDDGKQGTAYWVNRHGTVAGYSASKSAQWPTLWDRHGQPHLLQMPDGVEFGGASVVGDDGTAAGWFDVKHGSHCFRTSPDGVTTDLGDMVADQPNCFVSAIDRQGRLVGYSDVAGGQPHPFLWQDGQFLDLGLLPYADGAMASDINDRGAVVGTAFTSGSDRAFVWKDGEMKELGTKSYDWRDDTADAINDRGEIVGRSWNDARGNIAVRYEGDRTVPLPDEVESLPAGWVLQEARSIDDEGVIVGLGMYDDAARAFMLVPVGRGPLP